MKGLYLFEALLKAQSAEELHCAALKLAHSLGFGTFHYGAFISHQNIQEARLASGVIAPTPETSQKLYLLTGYPDSWLERYQDAGYIEIDPLVRHSAKNSLPILWEQCPTDSPLAAQMFDEARQHGLANGITLPIRAGVGEQALLNLVGYSDPKKISGDIAHIVGQAHLMASYLHEAMRRVVISPDIQKRQLPPLLTPREKECLTWAAAGKTNWEIGHILNIAERTAESHLTNAIQKLDAVNRCQAVARAVSMGLVSP